VTADPNPPERSNALHSESYRITVDDGRESFFALSIEDATNDDAWLMSDTVLALDEMR
jgi:hypothetical protein